MVHKDNASCVNHSDKNNLTNIRPTGLLSKAMELPSKRGCKTITGKRQDKMYCVEKCAKTLHV